MRPHWLVYLPLLLSFLASPRALGAQELAGPDAGTRVRIWLAPQTTAREGAAPKQVLRGDIITATGDSLVLQVHPGVAPVRIARSSILRLDQSRGVPPRLQSAMMTGAIGALLGAAEFAFLNRNVKEPAFESTSTAVWVGASAGALGGAVLGAWRPRERWRRIPLASVAVGIPASAGGAWGLSASASF